MMRFSGIGVDLVSIQRIKAALEEFGPQFLDKVLHPSEFAALPKEPQKQIAAIAKYWAAKEAVLKSLGKGLGDGISMTEIILTRLPSGAPQIRLENRDSVRFHVSLSDEKEMAIAFVMAEEGISKKPLYP